MSRPSGSGPKEVNRGGLGVNQPRPRIVAVCLGHFSDASRIAATPSVSGVELPAVGDVVGVLTGERDAHAT